MDRHLSLDQSDGPTNRQIDIVIFGASMAKKNPWSPNIIVWNKDNHFTNKKYVASSHHPYVPFQNHMLRFRGHVVIWQKCGCFSSVFCCPIFSSACWWMKMISESKANDATFDFPARMWHWNNVKAIRVMRWHWDSTLPHLSLFVYFVLCSHQPPPFISLAYIFLSNKQQEGHTIIRS